MSRCRYQSKLYGYEQGCRCQECVAARREYMRAYRQANPGQERRIGRRGEQKRAYDRKRATS